MAPAQVHPSPIEQIGGLLAASRRAGFGFSQAWDRVVRPGRTVVLTNHRDPPEGAIRFPTDSDERRVQREAILWARDEFRRASERRPPTRRELAVGSLTDLLEVLVAASERGRHPGPPPPQKQAPRPAAERVEAIAEFLRAHPWRSATEIVVAGVNQADGRGVAARSPGSVRGDDGRPGDAVDRGGGGGADDAARRVSR